MVHVERDREHVVALVVPVLGAVAVVDVPVDDGDARGARIARPLGAQRGVVEEAVAVGDAGRGVVAGRAHQRVGNIPLARHHLVDRRERGARRREASVERSGHERRGAREAPAARALGGAQLLQVGSGVEAEQLAVLGEAAFAPAHPVIQRPALEDRVDVAHPVGVLGMDLVDRHQRRRYGFGHPPPGVVREHALVPEDVDRPVSHPTRRRGAGP